MSTHFTTSYHTKSFVDARKYTGYSETDDVTAGLEACIAANPGKAIHLEGTFSVATSVNITAPGVTLWGEDGATMQPLTPGIPTFEMDADNITVAGINFRGTGTETIVQRGRASVRAHGYGGQIIRNRFENVDICAITAGVNSTNTVIVGNTSIGSLEHGIYLSETNGAAVSGNVVINAGRGGLVPNANGIKIADASLIAVSGCMIREGGGAAVLLDRIVTHGVSMSAISIENPGTYGLRIRDQVQGAAIGQVTITNYSATVPAIEIEGTNNRVCCSVIGPGAEGISLTASSSGNDVSGNISQATIPLTDSGTGNTV